MIASIYMALFSVWGILYMLYMHVTLAWPYIVLSIPIFVSEFVATYYYNRHKTETARINRRILFLQKQLYDVVAYLNKNDAEEQQK